MPSAAGPAVMIAIRLWRGFIRDDRAARTGRRDYTKDMRAAPEFLSGVMNEPRILPDLRREGAIKNPAAAGFFSAAQQLLRRQHVLHEGLQLGVGGRNLARVPLAFL